ncbi:MAG: type II toxin-antitoxin system RelE/ParE family toxin [Thermodesulfovibrionia bacterium]|nr:type II toxin-antitoxin system RelE/ParE family toxin [Thermodesulfovibrionia bacterium]
MKFQILYKKTFLKELKKLLKNIRIKTEHLCFDILPEIDNLADIKGLEKLVGYEKSYKVRFGDYCVGIEIDIESKVIECCRALHRKEIYRYYP